MASAAETQKQVEEVTVQAFEAQSIIDEAQFVVAEAAKSLNASEVEQVHMVAPRILQLQIQESLQQVRYAMTSKLIIHVIYLF